MSTVPKVCKNTSPGSGVYANGKILSDITLKCQLCQRYAKTLPQAVVSMPMAKDFNEKVAMALKYYKGRWILHMIDMWSRYTMSEFIHWKKTSHVIETGWEYLELWKLNER